MSDDTTTWLKKNPAINPLRRSLKTSMLFHVPSSDMNASIMSNPDKVKDQGLFIPRMLQRPKIEMRKSRAFEFKVPEVVGPKSKGKKEVVGSGMKKKILTPNKSKKSLLPVPKTKPASNEKNSLKCNLPRPSFMPGVSGRRTTVRRDFIKKVAEISEIKRKEAESSQLKAVSGDSSVLRSILKKRASLRRSSQISATKPKAKKVLFNGFESSDDEEKENDVSLALADKNDFDTAMDEPTVFLNFPKGIEIEESPFEHPKTLNWSVEETRTTNCDLNSIIHLWKAYKENLDCIKSERNTLEDSLESLLQHSLDFRKQYLTYKENSEEMYKKLTKLGQELEESLKKAIGKNSPEVSTPKRRSFGRSSEKIRISDKSRAIKKCSGKKKVLKRKNLRGIEGSLRTMPGKDV